MSETTEQHTSNGRARGRPRKAATKAAEAPKRTRRTKAQMEAAKAAAAGVGFAATFPLASTDTATSAQAPPVPISPKAGLSHAANKFLGDTTWPSVVIDQEVAAMIQIVAALDSCHPDARTRIMHWLADRYADLLPVTEGT